MNTVRALDLLRHNAATLREDLALIEAGMIKFTVFGFDVSHDHAGRMKANLARLEDIFETCECTDN